MNKPLTLEWIISTLKKSGVNSKQQVIDRLEKTRSLGLINLRDDIDRIIKEDLEAWNNDKNCPFEEFKEDYAEGRKMGKYQEALKTFDVQFAFANIMILGGRRKAQEDYTLLQEAVNKAEEHDEKEMAKKVVELKKSSKRNECPVCREMVGILANKYYCGNCGQKLYWEEKNEY